MSKENLTFFLVLGLTVGVFFYTWTTGEKEKAMYSQNYNHYADAAVKVESEPKEAIAILNRLEETTPPNYLYHLKKGIAQNTLANYEDASKEFQTALTLRPLLVEDATFLLHYAKTTYHTEEHALHKELVERASTMNLTEEQQLLSDELTTLRKEA